ncbi:MAG: metal ABC transporter substrate-binding protein [Ignavibacteriaceae bacterium]|jgi:zinc/manganese transport system substrate-binding protein|nr:metal ABC transporter substrate-binding protein [Ignavibacteriaceae bacterium]
MRKYLILILIVLFSLHLNAEIKVVATTTNIANLVQVIGGNKVSVDYLCRGDQDPHFLEVLPSYMLKLRNADIVFKIGLDLEKWLPQLIDGSRNDKLELVDLSNDISKKEVPTTKVDASQGDVHPYGNPHYWLDPENAKIMAEEIYNALTDFSSQDADYFKKNLNNFIKEIDSNMKIWTSKLSGLKQKNIITFHKSWIYFETRFGLNVVGNVEPKPGIPPTPSHDADLIQLIKKDNIKIILMENYYSDSAPNHISESTGIKVVKVPVAVYGIEGVDSYIKLIDYIVNQVSANG